MSNLESIASANNIVYVLWCPLAKKILYVGYTRNYPWERLALHMSEAKKPGSHPKQIWLRKLLAAGLLPTMRVLKDFDDKGAAYRYEAELIAKIGLKRPITNRSPGLPNWKPSPGWHFEAGKEPVFVPFPPPKGRAARWVPELVPILD